MANVLPLTFAFALAKVAVHRLGWEPWEFDALTGSLLGAATFVIAFMLSGTLSEYNASAAMPGQIVNAIETIQDTNVVVAMAKADYDPNLLQQALGELLGVIVAWLQENQPVATVDLALHRLNGHFATLLNHGDAPLVSRVQAEQGKIRLLVHQMKAIRDSEFLGPAYTLLELFLFGVMVALLLMGGDRFSEDLVVSGLLFTSFTYLVLLIKDLDNPFQYGGPSSIDVDLAGLVAARDRLGITEQAPEPVEIPG